MLEVLLFLSCSAFNSAFVANIASFGFKSEIFTAWEISDYQLIPFLLSLHQLFLL